MYCRISQLIDQRFDQLNTRIDKVASRIDELAAHYDSILRPPTCPKAVRDQAFDSTALSDDSDSESDSSPGGQHATRNREDGDPLSITQRKPFKCPYKGCKGKRRHPRKQELVRHYATRMASRLCPMNPLTDRFGADITRWCSSCSRTYTASKYPCHPCIGTPDRRREEYRLIYKAIKKDLGIGDGKGAYSTGWLDSVVQRPEEGIHLEEPSAAHAAQTQSRNTGDASQRETGSSETTLPPRVDYFNQPALSYPFLCLFDNEPPPPETMVSGLFDSGHEMDNLDWSHHGNQAGFSSL